MRYIVHRRFKDKALCGEVNLPAGTVCERDGEFITYCGANLCFIKSENAHQFFAVDDDSMGMVRGKLTQAIQKKLAKRDGQYQQRWDRIWEDKLCRQYRRKDYEDYWLWNHDFFCAEIGALRHIASLIGVKESE